MIRYRSFSLLLVFAIVQTAASLALAQDQDPPGKAAQKHAARWPLRLHVLAIDDTHRTVRMQPNWASGQMPDISDGGISPSNAGGVTLGGGDDDFSGAGRADLVTPPNATAGLDFSYVGCSRIRVAPGFQGLEARWKKPGKALEVIIPTEAITDKKPPTQRCTLQVKTQALIYLRLPSSKIVRVTQADYLRKPSLRMFLSGGATTLKTRTPELP